MSNENSLLEVLQNLSIKNDEILLEMERRLNLYLEENNFSEAIQTKWKKLIDFFQKKLVPGHDYNKNYQIFNKQAHALLQTEGGTTSVTPNESISDVSQDLLKVFVQDHTFLIESIDSLATDWQKGESQAPAKIKGFLHTLKGEFGSLGLKDYSLLIHELEDVFAAGFATPKWVGEVTFFLNDKMISFHKGIIPEINKTSYENLIPDALKDDVEISRLLQDIVNDDCDIVWVDDFEEDLENFYQSSLLELQKIVVVLQSANPSVEDIERFPQKLHAIYVASYGLAISNIGVVAGELETLLRYWTQSYEKVEEINKPFLVKVIGHLILILETEQKEQSIALTEVMRYSSEIRSILIESISEKKEIVQQKSVEKKSIRVNTDKLDTLIEEVGDAVLANASVLEVVKLPESKEKALFLEEKLQVSQKVLKQLQSSSMALRMVPVKPMFHKAERLVMDLCAKLQKNVEVRLEGEETEIDRTLVESLIDPLSHMIRNAMDHGLETPEERKTANKPEIGKIFLRAFPRAGNVVFEISDDGRGIDPEVIRKKAIEKGFLSPDANPTPAELYPILFEEGFSSASQVTDISGRGVGMDVVKKSIEKLQGSIIIESIKGKGTCFRISLPLTLALMDGMFVRCGNEKYILSTLFILESCKPNEEQIVAVGKGKKVFYLRDETYPLLHLSDILDVPCEHVDYTDGIVVLLQSISGNSLALFVHEILGQEQLVLKSIEPTLKTPSIISGSTLLANGNVCLVIEANEIFKLIGAKGGDDG